MITIRHDRAETVVEGTSKGDGTAPILKGNGFRWAPSVGAWTLNRTWHEPTRGQKARAAVAALNAAGIAAELVEDTAPAVVTAEDVAAQEADRAARAEARADRYAARAERTQSASDEAWNRASERASLIPFGQPILTDHYSAKADRRYRQKVADGYDKGARLHTEARELERRSQAAEANQRHRESLGATLRRIERLEAEARDVARRIEGTWDRKPAIGEHRTRLEVMRLELDAQLTYWRGHVAALEAAGERVWTRGDFQPGDFALISGNRWMRVVKANPKTLALETGVMPWPLKYGYSEVRARRTAAEHADAIRAEAGQVTA